MSEVYFYHLTRQPLELALPALLEKCLSVGWRVLVKSPTGDATVWLDEKLWTVPEDGFLPHGTDPSIAECPIVVTDAEDTKSVFQCVVPVLGADFLPNDPAVQRYCVLFNGNDDAELTSARQKWKYCKDQAIAAKYWSQETGSWQLKMG